MKIRIRTIFEGTAAEKQHYSLYCPGCQEVHQIDSTWQFDGNLEAPTISPSILKHGHWTGTPEDKVWSPQCHSFVRNGQWEFLADSEHALAGQTVPMVDLPDNLE